MPSILRGPVKELRNCLRKYNVLTILGPAWRIDSFGRAICFKLKFFGSAVADSSFHESQLSISSSIFSIRIPR